MKMMTEAVAVERITDLHDSAVHAGLVRTVKAAEPSGGRHARFRILVRRKRRPCPA
jgi:hypothetical protein